MVTGRSVTGRSVIGRSVLYSQEVNKYKYHLLVRIFCSLWFQSYLACRLLYFWLCLLWTLLFLSLSKLDPTQTHDLYQSLTAYATKLNLPTNAYLDSFPAVNHPQPHCESGDNVQYWIGKNGQILTMAFSVLLHTLEKFVKTVPYFDLNTINYICVC